MKEVEGILYGPAFANVLFIEFIRPPYNKNGVLNKLMRELHDVLRRSE